MFDIWGVSGGIELLGTSIPFEIAGLTEMTLVLRNALNGCTGTIMESSESISFSMGAGTAVVYSREKTRNLDIMERCTKFYLCYAVTRKGKGKSLVCLQGRWRG